MEPEIQGQHILGQAYLRPFGFKQGDKSVTCVWKKGETFTTLKGIKSFKKEDNFFDLPTITAIDARSFEKLNGQLETHYPAILEDIQANGCLEPKNEIFLKQFVANILCRTSLMRNSIERFYNDLNSREKFLKEISMFVKEPHFNGTELIETVDAKWREWRNSSSIYITKHF